MAFRRNDPHLVWRTNGGLYASSQGRTGKLCALRESPHGVDRFGPEPSVHSEMIGTRYGRRYRLIEPEEVWPGMTVAIDAFRGGRVQTSEITDVYQGVRVDAVAPGAEFLVFGRDEAALVTAHDEAARVVPLYESGWSGQRTSLQSLGLPERDDLTIIRIDRSFSRVSANDEPGEKLPGWEQIIVGLRQELDAIDPRIGIEHLDANPSDGYLTVVLSEVPGEAGRPIQRVRDAVLRAMEATAATCMECGAAGTITTIRNEDGARLARALCERHAVEQLTAEAALLGAAACPLPPNLEHARLEVGPGWYELLAGLCRRIDDLTPYTLVGCWQDRGDLLTRIELPESAGAEIRAAVRKLETQVREQAAGTCEHCGDPGERVEYPWRHPCCSECDDAELETMRLLQENDDEV